MTFIGVHLERTVVRVLACIISLFIASCLVAVAAVTFFPDASMILQYVLNSGTVIDLIVTGIGMIVVFGIPACIISLLIYPLIRPR